MVEEPKQAIRVRAPLPLGPAKVVEEEAPGFPRRALGRLNGPKEVPNQVVGRGSEQPLANIGKNERAFYRAP